MKVFVSEFLVGGASARGDSPVSMRQEGLAMLEAVAADIARMPGYVVVTTLETGVRSSLAAEIIHVVDANQESAVFQQQLKQVDAVLVIAPETDGILAGRCRQVTESGATSWNCSPEAIELCGDKLRLARHLEWQGVATIGTEQMDFREPPDRSAWPIVLKPRDGAGSQLTFLIRDSNDWDRALSEIRAAGKTGKMISQPFVPGRALSVGANIRWDGSGIELLPIGEQRLSDEGRFQYLGGKIPANLSNSNCHNIREVVMAACRSAPGLAGFIGFDLILTEESQPLIVEINPRLTTSYLGYRQLFPGALPERWISASASLPNPSQSQQFVEFDVPEMLK